MKSSNEALINACWNYDIDAATTAIDENMAQINTTVNSGNNPSDSTPIIIASTYIHGSKLVSLLLERGADITIRSSGYWYYKKESSTTPNRIVKGNALDVALFLGRVDAVKKLLLHAALHLDSDEQSRLLERMQHNNVLLYVVKTYPQYMNEMIKQILAQNDIALTQRIISEFIASASEAPNLQTKYQKLLDNLSSVMNELATIRFDDHLSWFQALPSSPVANTLVKNLEDAKLEFVYKGDKQAFIAVMLKAIETVLPSLGKQAAWKVAIGHFLEALAVIVPISRKQIEFYKKTDAVRQLEQMQADLSRIPSAPLAQGETMLYPEAFVVASDKNLEH